MRISQKPRPNAEAAGSALWRPGLNVRSTGAGFFDAFDASEHAPVAVTDGRARLHLTLCRHLTQLGRTG